MKRNRKQDSGWLRRLAQRTGLKTGCEPEDRDELHQLLKSARERALIDIDALSMIEGVLSVAELRARDIMIPRAQMVFIGRDDTLEIILPVVVDSAHSRFPVIGDDRGTVVGILLAKDLVVEKEREE